jgi:hypothetical protein
MKPRIQPLLLLFPAVLPRGAWIAASVNTSRSAPAR